MSTNLGTNDVGVLVKNWAKIRRTIMKIIKEQAKDVIDVSSVVPMTFDRDLVLGYGKWGLVVGLPSLDEIVVKITTDPFEWYLMELIMNDEELRSHPAVPYTVGTAVLDIKSKGLPLYLIVRENLHIGIPLNTSNPLVRMKDMLIRDFVQPMEEIEQEMANVLNSRSNLTLLDISILHSFMNGEIRKQITRVKAKLPRLPASSKFYNALDLQKKLLDRGIALVDIHVNNLGTRQYKNIGKLFYDVEKMDMDNVVISDLGMAYGTPVFLQAGMVYKSMEDTMDHLASILKEYSTQRSEHPSRIRNNPAIYSAESVLGDLIACCQDANLNVNNVLLDSKSKIHIDRIASKLVKMIPQMNLSDVTIAFLVKNELISIIKHWIDPYCVYSLDDSNIYIRCYVDSIDKTTARCRLSHDLSLEDEAPIGVFAIPQTHSLAEAIMNFYMNSKKRRSSNDSFQHIPIMFLSTLNGVNYENIQGL